MAGPYTNSGPLVGSADWARAPQGRVPDADCPKPPACPACGGLECLCRPRFFAGQLLTEDDLNRLENYVVAKNKLHNRYLHGWGVVCGLEVVCDPCGEGVIVRPGYALAPCGEDIVVCDDQVVDVCALIEACRPVYDPCPPMAGTVNAPASGPSPCGDAIDPWILAICYDERPSRGVTPLRPPPASCACGGKSGGCGCGCGGKTKSKSGGCGCGGGRGTGSVQQAKGCGCGSNTGKAAQARGTYATRGAAAVACEPTLICEGYRFIAYKQVPSNPVRVGTGVAPGTATADSGALIERVLCCWQALLTRLQSAPPISADRATRARWCCDMRAALIELVTSHPTYDCGLAAKARAIVCPDPNQHDFDTAITAAQATIVEIGAAYIRYCICQALLPPCPDATDGDCVPLAVIEVRRSDCHVVSVCNWGPRRIALGFPQLEYWLSPLHLGEALSQVIERLCCTPLSKPGTITVAGAPAISVAGGAAPGAMPLAAGVPGATPAASSTSSTSAAPANAAQTAALLSFESFRNASRSIDATTVLLDALGILGDKNQPLLTPLERASPVSFLLANQVTAPFVSSLLPGANTAALGVEVVSRLLGGAQAPTGAAPTTGPAPTANVADLHRMVTELSRTVAAQGDEIKKLRNRRAPER